MADNTNGTQTMSVLNPMGYPPKITPKALAPRLDSLDGKTVYLVDPRFDDSGLFLRQLQNWFSRQHADGKDQIRRDEQRLHQGRPQDLGGDQSGRRRRHHRCRPLKHLRAGGRRACNDPREQVRRAHRGAAHPCVSKKLVGSVNRVHGMPRAPRAFVPQPVMGKTAEQLRAYIDGKTRSAAGR